MQKRTQWRLLTVMALACLAALSGWTGGTAEALDYCCTCSYPSCYSSCYYQCGSDQSCASACYAECQQAEEDCFNWCPYPIC